MVTNQTEVSVYSTTEIKELKSQIWNTFHLPPGAKNRAHCFQWGNTVFGGVYWDASAGERRFKSLHKPPDFQRSPLTCDSKITGTSTRRKRSCGTSVKERIQCAYSMPHPHLFIAYLFPTSFCPLIITAVFLPALAGVDSSSHDLLS